MAALGNESALSSFAGTGKAYLDAALRSARTQSEYQDAQAMVVAAANAAITGAEQQASGASSQIAALNQQSALLESSDASLTTLTDTSAEMAAQLAALADLQVDGVIPAITRDVGGAINDLAADLRLMIAEIRALRDDAKASSMAAQARRDEVASMLRGAHRGNRFNIGNESDQPIAVSGEVRVNNTAETPFFVNQV